MFEKITTEIDGCFIIQLKKRIDIRGSFVKIFHETVYEDLGLPLFFAEEYFSTSKKGVFRGMHFQLPPHDHYKMVFCINGLVKDFVLDLRKKSSTFGKNISIELSGENNRAVFIPKGLAHGFYSKEDDSILFYKVSTVYNPDADTGILWDSCDLNFNIKEPILSDRDSGFISFEDFNSPF